MKRKALITSMALLLVAVICLSTATYAWFSANTTVTAQTLTLTAAGANGIYIIDDTTNLGNTPAQPAATAAWTNAVTWSDDIGAMAPASSAFAAFTLTPTFYYTTTTNANGTWDSTTAISGTTSQTVGGTQYFLAKRVWVKADTTDSVTLKCTVTIAGSNIKGYERVAVVNATQSSSTPFLFADAATSANAFTSTSGSTTAAAAGADGQFTAYTGVISGSSAQCFDVYCWFEGQDATCMNANAGASYTVGLSFTTA